MVGELPFFLPSTIWLWDVGWISDEAQRISSCMGSIAARLDDSCLVLRAFADALQERGDVRLLADFDWPIGHGDRSGASTLSNAT